MKRLAQAQPGLATFSEHIAGRMKNSLGCLSARSPTAKISCHFSGTGQALLCLPVASMPRHAFRNLRHSCAAAGSLSLTQVALHRPPTTLQPSIKMAWSRRKTKSGKFSGKDKDGKGSYNIPKYMLFSKHALAPYPNESSNPLYSGDLKAEEFLEFKAIAKSRTASNCEFLRRPGVATSLAASALRVGSEELIKGSLGGLESMIKFAKGKKDFVKCLKVLDTGKTRQPDKKQVERATNVVVDTLQNLDAEERKGLSDLALTSARLYLFAMNALEAADMLGNPKLYARKLEKTPDGRKFFGDFMKDPSDSKKLKAMLVRCLLEKIKSRRTRRPRRSLLPRTPQRATPPRARPPQRALLTSLPHPARTRARPRSARHRQRTVPTLRRRSRKRKRR